YDTLTNQLALDIPSREVHVVASVDTNGSFKAVASFRGRMDDEDILPGLYERAKIRRADLTFTDAGVALDAEITLGGEAGTGTFHLDVGTDGSFHGHVDIFGTRVLNAFQVDLHGDISAPAGGPITGSVQGDLTHPAAITPDVWLDAAHIAYGPDGLDISGTV